MAITRQQLIRDFTQLIKTRGVHQAALGGTKTNSDWYKVYTHVAGNLAAPAGTVLRLVIDFDQATLDAMGEKATGAENTVIPAVDRV